ncbi:MAG TPA: DUF853 family protein [Bacteroidales bacterium]|nr:DUF853 family protein [Bacteroidales bacterium]HNS45849.1 DUF853 family protein [Bacteroidales bacterium]
MGQKEKFISDIQAGYTFKKDYFVLGGAMFNREPIEGTQIKIPLKTITRHGLISGATGTGKTKTLQVIAEQLSLKGIPVVLMDIKGDLSGLAQPGQINDHVIWRQKMIGETYEPLPMPVELMSISGEHGVRLRSTISEFGPVLFSKILGLNDTQSSVISMIFKYCDDHKLPLIDLKDFRKMLQFVSNEGKAELQKEYGAVSGTTVSTIIRKIIEIEEQEADRFFGEPSFEPEDLLLMDKDGRGVISIIRLTDIQDKPKLFSTFMLCLLAEIYNTFPELGDVDRPKLVLFIDEAHLIFKEATSALLDQLDAIIKLIRSKGVGVYFCTQDPNDVPDSVLAQLGLKVQHALRAFTAKDRQMIKRVAQNFPISEYYETEDLLTSLGTGEALVTVLNEKGVPTPLTATLLRAPLTRMDVLRQNEIDALVSDSQLVRKYNQPLDRQSAYEIITQKLERASEEEYRKAKEAEVEKARKSLKKQKESPSVVEKLSKNTMVRQLGRTVMRELTRGILGTLGIKLRR